MLTITTTYSIRTNVEGLSGLRLCVRDQYETHLTSDDLSDDYPLFVVFSKQ